MYFTGIIFFLILCISHFFCVIITCLHAFPTGSPIVVQSPHSTSSMIISLTAHHSFTE